MPSNHADFPFWDSRRPWRLTAAVLLGIATFVLFWLVVIILSLGEAVGGPAVVAAGFMSALGVIAGLLDWRDNRRRYPPEERGSFRAGESLTGAAVLLVALGADTVFGTWAWSISA